MHADQTLIDFLSVFAEENISRKDAKALSFKEQFFEDLKINPRASAFIHS